MRGFKIANGYKDAILPKRSTHLSAGYDFHVAKEITLGPGEKRLVETGIKAYMQDDEVLKIYMRSSIAKKYPLNLPNGVGIIDADYFENDTNDGAIFILLHNYGNDPITLTQGMRIAQGIFQKYLLSDEEAKPKISRLGGFGSTGK